MTRRSSESLVRELARDLLPVRPIPRLRFVTGVVATLALGGAAWALWRDGGVRPDLLPVMQGSATFDAILLAMTGIGISGLVAGVALCVPGRETLGSRAAVLAVLGAAFAFVAVPLGIVAMHVDPLRLPEAGDLLCMRIGLGAAAAAAFAGLGFGWRTAPRSLPLAAALAASGAGAVGALAVHLACPSPHAWHWLWGHAGVAVVAALLAFAAGSALRALRPPPVR